MTSLRTTQYGFNWGPVVVERVAHIDGRGYCVSVRGRKDYNGHEVQVYISEKGRVVTAYLIRGASARSISAAPVPAEKPIRPDWKKGKK